MKNLLTLFAVLCVSVAISVEIAAARSVTDVGTVSVGQVFTVYFASGEYCVGYPADLILVSTGSGYANFKFDPNCSFYQDTPFQYSFGTNKGTEVWFKGIVRKNK